MPSGYHGKILRVDLTEKKCWTEDVPDKLWRKYLGGSAMCSHFLLRELKPGVDPLSPDNILVIMTSVMNGTTISGANRFSAAAKSPLNNGFGESEAGGYWAPELKAAGFDGIIVHGRADKPVWLWINDGKCEFRDATQYWGKISGEVQDGIEEELGDKRIRVLQTGIAGENFVRFAAIVNQLKHFNGRCGLGAVMASKNLKAIVVRGKARVEPKDKAGALGVLKWFKDNYDRDHDMMHLYGTSRVVKVLHGSGILPTRNFREGGFEKFEDISGQRMRETILVNEGTCYACSVACKREVDVPELGVTKKYGGPEYETLAASGSNCGVGDLKKLALVNQLLGEYVLDSISTGAVIAFAMECFEEGILTKDDCDGIELRFGNEEAVVRMVHKIARREGIGDVLAEGVRRAAQKIGNGAEKFALHVKGQELPMHEPRGKKSLALAYSCSPTGADHMEAPHDTLYEGFHHDGHPLGGPLGLLEPLDMLDFGPKKVRAFFECQKVWSFYNCVGMCDFVGVPIGSLRMEKLVEYINHVTGWDMSLYEALKVGERAHAMARIFNTREGFTPADDTLPERMFEPLQGGALKGESLDREQFEKMKNLYYRMCGWDPETGMPTEEKLAELDLLEFGGGH
jgi:aldehyde:ferredoxin oxidoreductase